MSLGYDLDQLGITICNVGGTNFTPYVRLAAALSLPFAVVTDWDPRADGNKAYGWNRSLKLIRAIRGARADEPLPPKRALRLGCDEKHLRKAAERHGIFLNEDTLETEIARTPSLVEPLLNVLREQEFGLMLTERIDGWLKDHSRIDNSQLMLMIGYVSKGRFADRLAEMTSGLEPPEYIKLAIEHVVNNG
jgi:putative ATP-dependent endonuclease of OLD family